MSNEWLIYALPALVIWGVTAFIPKLVLRSLHPLHMVVYSGAFSLAIATCVVSYYGLVFEPRAALLAAATGVCYAVGQVFYLLALQRGPVVYVSMLASLYPLGTVLLAFQLLHEPLTLRQGLAVLLGLTSVVLLVTAKTEEKKVEAA